MDIRWNGAAPAIEDAATAQLEILDYARRRAVSLDKPHLRKGSFTFVREGQRVDIRMHIRQHDGTQVEEITSFLGPKPMRHPSPEELEMQHQRDALARQAEQTQANLRAVCSAVRLPGAHRAQSACAAGGRSCRKRERTGTQH